MTQKQSQAKQTKPQAEDVMKPVEDAVNAGKQQVETVVKASNEAATKNYEQMVAMTQDQMQKASDAMFKGYDDVNALNKANIDAVVQASTALTKGMESLSRQLMGIAQASMEANVASTKALFGAKTLRDFFDLQADFYRRNIDQVLSESAKVTETSVKVTNDALQPLQAQTNANVEKLFKPAA